MKREKKYLCKICNKKYCYVRAAYKHGIYKHDGKLVFKFIGKEGF